MDRICTIIAQNYLPQAMILLDSVRRIYPKIEFYILVTDSKSDFSSLLPSAIVLKPEDLKIDQKWLSEMKSYYDTVELATSLKPFLLQSLLVEGISTVTFLDPDILLLNRLDLGINSARVTGVALTPHRIKPGTLAEINSTDLSFLRYGVYNLGYICVGHAGKPMLSWWASRLRWYCTRFPDDIVFTDQKWLDLAPAYFDVSIIKHPGYDLAPWNISERSIYKNDSDFYTQGHELVFIHFSQMSSSLAKGVDPGLWYKGALDSEESLQIIKSLTEEYSSKLLAASKVVTQFSENIPRETPNVTWDSSYRKRLIRHSISRELNDKTHRKIRQWRFKSNILLLLERSATFRGFLNGIKIDGKKFTQRFR